LKSKQTPSLRVFFRKNAVMLNNAALYNIIYITQRARCINKQNPVFTNNVQTTAPKKTSTLLLKGA
jgi:hypothetical protein